MPTKAEKTPIRITCSGKGLIARKQLIALQGHLKKISRKNLEKLKNRILKKGFNVPYHLWIDEQGASYILDGHQRTLALMELEAQGHPVPDRLPYDIIEAKDIEDAKDALLGISSQYGEFTLEGLRDFSAGMKLDADLRLPSGEIVLDMFAGSGSTLIGCQRTGRLFRGIELDKRFVDLIVKRWCLWIHARHLEPEVTRNGKAFEWRRFCPEIA
jgi:hypothetical protein